MSRLRKQTSDVEPAASAAPIWRLNPPTEEWDSALAALGGHPLQSSLWGEARKKADGIADQRWLLERDRNPLWMIRIERRPLPLIGWVGWAPWGPAGTLALENELFAKVASTPRTVGMRLLVTDRWMRADREATHFLPRTIWIDLNGGESQVWEGFDRGFRWSVRKAEKTNVVVEETRDLSRVEEFYALCHQISLKKEFALATSPCLMKFLLERGSATVEARLFTATVRHEIAAGAFVVRCGRSAHYFWGASNRSLSSSQAGQAVQWAAIKWAISRGCSLYDLEGIDPLRNPGTYAFKKKMGGEEVSLTGKQYFSVSIIGRALARVDRVRRA